jgi:signal transduction histidine kinase
MPESTVSQAEFEKLRERARRLALEKSYLQLVHELIRKLSAVTGVEDTAAMIARLILDSIGGSNVAVYFYIGEELHFADAYGQKKRLEEVDDEMVLKAIGNRRFIEESREFEDTKMITPEFTKSSYWALPLIVGETLIGALKMDGMLMAADEVRRQIEPFFSYAALVLKNEILGHTRLKKAYDQLSEKNVALEAINAALEKAYKELKAAQTQLLQQDKMASIGQLAAGMAHEINNPMSFIISNLSSFSKYVAKLTAYLIVSEKLFCEQSTPGLRGLLEQEKTKYKVNAVLSDLPDLVCESLDGAERVRKIVEDLKNFSRVDRAEFSYEDLNQAIESTLSIAWNEIKGKAEVIKDYGALPMVYCNTGQINQVFLNILINASHAIETKGEIRITTWSEDDCVYVKISDSGRGIPPEHLKHVFEPFFTTKEVGQGMGLGLAIAYDIIVNKHGGRIEVESSPDIGTTFIVTMPIKMTGSEETSMEVE